MLRKPVFLTDSKIRKLINIPEALRVSQEAFKAHGQNKFQMPAKIYLHLDKYRGDFRAMPAYLEKPEACGIKWVNVHPGNKKYGLPSVMALIILNAPKTGLPLAVLDGTYITNLRTGAAGGIAAKYLARKDSSRIALIGCGAQAQTQLMALNEILDIKTVFLYDCLKSQAEIFLKKTRYLGLEMIVHNRVKDCVREADILVTDWNHSAVFYREFRLHLAEQICLSFICYRHSPAPDCPLRREDRHGRTKMADHRAAFFSAVRDIQADVHNSHSAAFH